MISVASCSIVPCDVVNCAVCSQANICRECDDGFELSGDGNICSRTAAEISQEAGLSLPAIVGTWHTRQLGKVGDSVNAIGSCV